MLIIAVIYDLSSSKKMRTSRVASPPIHPSIIVNSAVSLGMLRYLMQCNQWYIYSNLGKYLRVLGKDKYMCTFDDDDGWAHI